jgi:hypothetical protein
MTKLEEIEAAAMAKLDAAWATYQEELKKQGE